MLIVLLIMAAALYVGQLRLQQLPWFYSDVVAAMSQSWRTWWFGGLDRLGSVTIDKQVGAFWPQALLVRVFGLHPWVLSVPQIVEGLLSVVVVYVMVRRPFGALAATIAGLAFVLTPIATSVMGHSMEDGLLTLAVVLAAWAWQLSSSSGRMWPIVASGVFVGLGFQAKMAQAWLILPALVLTELLLGSTTLRRRCARAAVLATTGVVTSLLWVGPVDLDASRPFVDGTRNGNPFTMVFGYNLLERFGIHVGGSLPVYAGDAGSVSSLKLLEPLLLSQWGLLAPVALVGTLVLVSTNRRTDETWRRTQLPVVVMWCLWAAITFAAFSAGALAHTSYLVALAAPVSALVGAGGVALAEQYRARGRWRLALPFTVAAVVATGVLVQRHFLDFVPNASTILAVAGSIAVVGATVCALISTSRHVRGAVLGGSVMVVLFLPVIWTGSVLFPHDDGSANDASAGPGGLQMFRAAATARLSHTDPRSERDVVQFLALEKTLASTSPHLRYVLVSNKWQPLSPLIEYGTSEVLPLGGFTGYAPTMSRDEFRNLVKSGQARYFLFVGNAKLARKYQSSDANQISSDVFTHCALMHVSIPTPDAGARLFSCTPQSFGAHA